MDLRRAWRRPVARVLRRSEVWQHYRALDGSARLLGRVEGIHSEWSFIRSDLSVPSDALIDLALRAIADARTRDLSAIDLPGVEEPLVRWPGSHYRLLPALALAHGARRVVEIGTLRGASSAAFLAEPTVEHVVSYDVEPWTINDPTFITADVLASGRWEQRVGDLADPAYFATQADTLADADLILVDGPKDSIFEPAFLPQLVALAPRRCQLLVIDDVKFLNMVQLWHDLPYDKFDLASFGHFTGTGVALRPPT